MKILEVINDPISAEIDLKDENQFLHECTKPVVDVLLHVKLKVC